MVYYKILFQIKFTALLSNKSLNQIVLSDKIKCNIKNTKKKHSNDNKLIVNLFYCRFILNY